MNYNKKYSHNSVFLSPPILRSQAPCYRRARPWLQSLSPSCRLHITSKMMSCVAAYLLVYYEQNTRRFTCCATLTQTTCLAQEIAHTIIKFTHQLCNIKHMLIKHYTLPTPPLLLKMKQQKPAPTNENLVYIFTSLIHPVAKL